MNSKYFVINVIRDLCQRHCLRGIVGGGSRSARAVSKLIQKITFATRKIQQNFIFNSNSNEIESNLKIGMYLDSMDTCHAIHDTIVFALLPYDSHDLFDFKNDRQ
jgi:hypothetical protein